MPEEQNNESHLARPGATLYMEAPTLRRGATMPNSVKAIIAALGLVSLAITALFGFGVYQNIINAPARYEQSIQEAINSGPGLQLPTLSSFTESDNPAIREALASNGYSLIDVDEQYAGDEGTDEHSIDLVKIPADMDYEKGTELFSKSLRRASVTDAAHFLAGTWRFTSYNAEGVDLKVKYADFSSPTIEEAIMKAISDQGWSDSTFGESGVDQSGNTFQSGTISINDRNFHWTVSACPLDEVYNVNGLPENSFYVGARLVQ